MSAMQPPLAVPALDQRGTLRVNDAGLPRPGDHDQSGGADSSGGCSRQAFGEA